jgi:prepilin-type N-terminal cleavage/methylation domain-containing protein/prepilin-type processing-associated H-X9-DG protein
MEQRLAAPGACPALFQRLPGRTSRVDRRPGASRRGFTLVELLVVVAIIALLVSILLPGLSAVRRASRATVCGTTLRELARGCTIYAQEHREVMVANRPAKLSGDNLYWVGNGWKYRPRWLASLGAAVEIYAFKEPRGDDSHQTIENRLLVCPETPEWVSERNSSYGYNYQFLGNARRTLDGQRFVQFPVQIGRIHGQTVVLADALGTAAHYPAAERSDNRPDGSAELRAAGNHAYMLDPPRLTDRSDTCDEKARGIRSGPDARHAGTAGFAFADGHVERVRPERLGYGIRPGGSFEMTGDLVHNRYFSGTARDDDPPPIDP